MAARNPLRRSTIPGNTSTNRSTSAVGRRPADRDAQRMVGVDAHRLRAPATVRASPTSTTSPSAPRRRAGRARAGSVRPRRRRRRGTAGWAATLRRGVAEPLDAGHDVDDRRGPRRSARAARAASRADVDVARTRRRSRPTRGRSRCPPRRARSCAPPTSSGGDAQAAPHEQRARALRSAELVRGHRAQVGAERGERHGHVPAAAHASTCTSTPALARRAQHLGRPVAPCRPRGSRAAR